MSSNRKTISHYLMAQIAFWGGYFILNLIFMGLWGSASFFFSLMFVALSFILGAMSHGFRYLYKTYAQHWPPLKIILNLVWLIPISALSAQLILFGFILAITAFIPATASGAQPTNTGGLLAYAMNYGIMLALWSTLYLLRKEFVKRRNSEIAHWQLQAQLKENELQFLRSQINSHFLFNAINNLRSLVKEDAEQAREGLTNLSVLLRGLLHNDGQQLVTLREEMEWVKGYLSLEALQFENRLSTTIEVDETLFTAKLPPLILQTLVENAIKHGIAARRAGGHLTITIKKSTPTYWQIKVINPLPEFPSTHQGNKIGLRNARERLVIAFGEQANLNLDIAEQVTATVEIPL
jgi:LytS/YehU family sensor histidine kinase